MDTPSAIFTSDDGTLTIWEVDDQLVVRVKGTDRQKKEKDYRFSGLFLALAADQAKRKKKTLEHWGYKDRPYTILQAIEGVGDSEGDLEAVVRGDTMVLHTRRPGAERRQIAGPYTIDEARRMVGAIAGLRK